MRRLDMDCPICNTPTKVTDTSKHAKGRKRRRECPDCLTRFTTYENMNINSLPVSLRIKVWENFINKAKKQIKN